MQSVAVLNEKMINERGRTLNNAAQRLVVRLFGCWQHELSRPFTRNGKTHRVCVKCGLSRDFDLNTWETHGASYTPPPSSLSGN